MPISVTCRCGKSYRLEDNTAGTTIPCEQCGAPIVVPAGATDLVFNDEPFTDKATPGTDPGRVIGSRPPGPLPQRIDPPQGPKKVSGLTIVLIVLGCAGAFLLLACLGVTVFGYFAAKKEAEALARAMREQQINRDIFENPEPTPRSPVNSIIEADSATGEPPGTTKPDDESNDLIELQRTKWCIIPRTKDLETAYDRITFMSFLDDASKLLTVSKVASDHEIAVWDLNTGKAVARLPKHDQCALSADRKTLIARSTEKQDDNDSLSICDASTLTVRRTFEAILFRVSCLSPDGRNFAYWDAKTKNITLLDLESGGWRTLVLETPELGGLCYSSDGKTLLSYVKPADRGVKGRLFVWDIESGKLSKDLRIPEGDSGILSAGFGPEDKVFAAGLKDGDIKLWEIETFAQTGSWPSGQSEVAVASDDTNKRLVSVGRNGHIRLWDWESHHPLATLGPFIDAYVLEVPAFAVSADGNSVAAAAELYSNKGERIRIFDISNEAIKKAQDEFMASNLFHLNVLQFEQRLAAGEDAFMKFYGNNEMEIEGAAQNTYKLDQSDEIVLRPVDTRLSQFWLKMKLPDADRAKFPRIWETQVVKVNARLVRATSDGVEFDNCQVFEMGKDPFLEITAEELAKEFLADDKAAATKYEKVLLMIDGVLQDPRIEEGFLNVHLVGATRPDNVPVTVNIFCGSVDEKTLSELTRKKGSRVRILGSLPKIPEDDKNTVQLIVGTIP